MPIAVPQAEVAPPTAAAITVQIQPLPGAAAALTAGAPGCGDNFAGLRLVAALLVVHGHVGADATGTFGLRLLMFFALSGFGLAASWQRDPHAGRFLLRRLLRVWPAYAVVVVAGAAATALWPAPDMPQLSRLASWFYLGNLWFSGFDWGFFAAPHRFLNQSLWMMRYEVDLYLACAAAGLLLGRRAWLLALPVLAAALALRAAPPLPEAGGLFGCWSLAFSGFFAAGVLLQRWCWLRHGAVAASCVAAGALLLLAGERNAGLLLVIPPGAVWVGLRSWPLLRAARRFGDLSYGIFLWASPVQQLTRLWLAPDAPALLQWAAVALQAAALAWLSWRLVEQPALGLRPRAPVAPALTPVSPVTPVTPVTCLTPASAATPRQPRAPAVGAA